MRPLAGTASLSSHNFMDISYCGAAASRADTKSDSPACLIPGLTLILFPVQMHACVLLASPYIPTQQMDQRCRHAHSFSHAKRSCALDVVAKSQLLERLCSIRNRLTS